MVHFTSLYPPIGPTRPIGEQLLQYVNCQFLKYAVELQNKSNLEYLGLIKTPLHIRERYIYILAGWTMKETLMLQTKVTDNHYSYSLLLFTSSTSLQDTSTFFERKGSRGNFG